LTGEAKKKKKQRAESSPEFAGVLPVGRLEKADEGGNYPLLGDALSMGRRMMNSEG